MSDSIIIDTCKKLGVDYAQLRSCLDSSDNWGRMVNAVVYLTVLNTVCEVMKREQS